MQRSNKLYFVSTRVFIVNHFSWDGMPILDDNSPRENYLAISPWTELRVAALHELYMTSTLSMQCNKSDGNRFQVNYAALINYSLNLCCITQLKLNILYSMHWSLKHDDFFLILQGAWEGLLIPSMLPKSPEVPHCPYVYVPEDRIDLTRSNVDLIRSNIRSYLYV